MGAFKKTHGLSLVHNLSEKTKLDGAIYSPRLKALLPLMQESCLCTSTIARGTLYRQIHENRFDSPVTRGNGHQVLALGNQQL
jgi:hypothetical protein